MLKSSPRQVGTAVSSGARPLTALAVVVGLAVLREGSEVVLFLYGIMASGTSGSALLLGGLLGIAGGAAFTALTYFGLLAIPTRYVGFELDDVFVIGYGLDHAQRYRNLPYIAALQM